MRELLAKNKKKRETARVRTREPLKKTAKVGTIVPPQTNSQGKDPRTSKRTNGKVARSEKAKGREVEEVGVRREDSKLLHGEEKKEKEDK